MAINISDAFHAAALVGFAVPGVPIYINQNGFVGPIVDNAPGDFTLTMSQGLDVQSRIVHVTPVDGAARMTAVTSIDDFQIRVRTFDAAGVLIDDVPVCVSVKRFAL
jgi:hypothetical protein